MRIKVSVEGKLRQGLAEVASSSCAKLSGALSCCADELAAMAPILQHPDGGAWVEGPARLTPASPQCPSASPTKFLEPGLLNSLQNLRALACYGVIFYHCAIRFLAPEDVGASWLDIMSAGVDLFFMISGFVMVLTTREDESPAWFANKRIARIVPLYWAATFSVIALVLIRPWTFPNANLSPEGIASSLAFIPHPDSAGFLYPILGVGWTLNYEMTFYFLFCLSLFLPRNLQLAGVTGLITAVFVGAHLSGNKTLVTFYGNPIVFDFMVGCLLAWAMRQKPLAEFCKRVPMWPIAILAFVVLIVSFNLTTNQDPTVVRYAPAAFLLLFAAVGQDMHRKPTPETIFTKLGDASYSAYLFHPSIIIVIVAVVEGMLGRTVVSHTAVLVLTVAVTAPLSLVSLYQFEKRSARIVRRLVESWGVKPPMAERRDRKPGVSTSQQVQ